MALASCGGGSSSDGTTAAHDANPSAELKAAAPGTNENAGAKTTARADLHGGVAENPAATSGCRARIGNFVHRMTDLRQSLLAGLSYAEYVVRVKAIGDAYEAVPVDRLGVDCLSGPAGAAEDAFNQYLRAANVWGKCAGTAGCAAGEIEGRLQHRWKIASKSLDAAARG